MKKAGLITSSMRVRREEGFILPTAIGLGVVVLVLSTTALVLGSINQRNSSAALGIAKAQFAAEAGLDHAQLILWTKVWNGLAPGTRALYANKIDQTSYESGDLAKSKAGTDVSYPSSGPDYALDNGATYTFKVKRRVAAAGDLNVIFDVTSTGKMPDGTVRILNQVFQPAASPYGGLEYAILSNNINCIFCHTRVQDMQALGGVASSSHPIDRVKVGTLQLLQIDDTNGSPVHTADTMIAGSLHVRGEISGAVSSNPANSSMKTILTNGTNTVDSNNVKDFVTSDCTVLSNCSTPGNDLDKRSLYKNYPTKFVANGSPPDGDLPDSFPSPVADDGAIVGTETSIANNRIIDDGEWDTQVGFSNTGLDDENPAGSITGGIKNDYSDATVGIGLSGGVWPIADNVPIVNSTGSRTSGIVTTHNLILDGKTSTLIIDGTIFVNGDVIIRGKVQGKGKIIARRNIYVLGDLTYDCSGLPSSLSGGSDCNYTKNKDTADKLPQLGIIAGENILIGDFMTVRGQDFKNFSRAEETVELGSRDLYKTGNAYTKKIPTGSRPSFTYREMAIFNRQELIKYQSDPLPTTDPLHYKPRFYTMRENTPVVISQYSGGTDSYTSSVYTEYSTQLGGVARVSTSPTGEPTANDNANIRDGNGADVQKLSSGTDPLVSTVLALVQSTNSVKIPLVHNWLNTSDLKKAWINSRECASCATGPLRTDGLLYSGNSTFAVSRVKPAGGFNIDTDVNQVSTLNGAWDLRGSLVTADLGALVTGQNLTDANKKLTVRWGQSDENTANIGLSVYYDPRMKSFFQSSGTAKLSRNSWVIGSKE